MLLPTVCECNKLAKTVIPSSGIYYIQDKETFKHCTSQLEFIIIIKNLDGAV